MSEQLEQWKAREKTRGEIGWAAQLLGIIGGVLVLFGGLGAFGWGEPEGRLFGLELGPLASSLLALVTGLVLLVCARGLWNVQPWARWAVVALFGLSILSSTIAWLVGSGSVPMPVFAVLALVYLLRPSTGRHFRRAQGSAGPAP